MYLIYGDSFRLIEDEIAKIVKDETNVITLDYGTSSLNDILTEASYVSMFQEKKFLIVKNASFFTSAKDKEDDINLLLSYMENPISLTTIIFVVYDKIDMRKKITKEFSAKYKIISLGNLSKNDLMTKTRDLVFKNKYKISNDALEYIIDCCQNNYDFIYNEVHKVFLFYMEPQEIKLEDVKHIISKTMIDNNFKFVEAVINKDIKKTLVILDDLMVLKVDAIALIMLLAREYRLMLSVKTLMSVGYPKKSICKELALQDWQVDKLSKNCTNYYDETLEENLKKLANIDFLIKSGSGDKDLELKKFLLDNCI